jgi:hypothetical protein
MWNAGEKTIDIARKIQIPFGIRVSAFGRLGKVMGTAGTGAPATQVAIQLAAVNETPVFFTGPPQALQGNIPLVNTGGDKEKIRSIAVKGQDLKGPASLPLNEIPFYAKLHPGQQASVPGTITLDPTTPPGKYNFEIMVAGKSVPATAQVAEVVDFRITPRNVTILAGSATKYTRQFVIENRGNVDLPTGAKCEATIFDSFDLITGLLDGLHKADRTSVESMVKGFLVQWADLEAGTLTISRMPVTVHPGDKLTVDVDFTLPKGLKPLRHYHANLQLYNATLAVDIYTKAKSGS